MRRIDKIFIHCSATPPDMYVDADLIDVWHKQRGWSGCGYHYVIKRDGQIELGRPIEKIGAHVKGFNKSSIGICYCGGVDGDMKEEDNRTDDQKKSLLLLLNYLKNVFPKAEVHGHRDFSPKFCPSFDATTEYKNI
tara:strand:+ start:8948 stop:9355 length:408 start_codon:yes stop_codon:yes gene_type:complete